MAERATALTTAPSFRRWRAPRPKHVTLYYREADADRSSLAGGNVRAEQVSSPAGWLWGPMSLPPRLRRDRISVLHSQYILPPIAPCPAVVTIHDVTFHLFPEWFPKRAGRIMNALIPMAARSSTRILTVSECSKRDIVRCFQIPEDKVVVTYNGVGPQYRPVPGGEARLLLTQKYPALTSRYLLGVGLRGLRKNAGIVVQAARRLQSQGKWPDDLQIVLTGDPDQYDFPEAGDLAARIAYLGYVADEDLPALYSQATLCFYPSLYEGFGLPPLEAMACGCPVLVSDTSSLPEVVGNAGISCPRKT